MSERTFPIVILAKAKNGKLWDLIKQVGSQAALARSLGIFPGDIGRLVNMDAKTPLRFDTPKWQAAERKLVQLYGLTWDDVVPAEIRTARFLAEPKRRELRREVQLDRLTSQQQRLLLPDPVEVAADRELREEIHNQLRTLSHREREIINLLFGFGGPAYTTTEIAANFGVTAGRIRQIANSATHKLQACGLRSDKLRTLMTDRCGERSLAEIVAARKARERAAQQQTELEQAEADKLAFMNKLLSLTQPPSASAETGGRSDPC